MIRVIKFDINRTLFSAGFMAAIFVTFLLCFTENIYINTSTMQAFSVFEALFRFDRAFMESRLSFCSLTVFKSALSGYSAMFLPILASFPFVYSQSIERNSGNIRFLISRTKRQKYYLSKFICAVLSGGVCIMFGVMLFGFFSFFVFPHPTDYTVPDPEFYASGGILAEIVKKLFSSFIYGCANTVFAFFLSSFCRNRYIVLCVPFLMRFMQDTAMKKNLEAGSMLYSTIAVMVIFMTLMLFGYIMVMERRTDKGE